ncbi:MAG: site-specific integrase [Thiohalospira sp.]
MRSGRWFDTRASESITLTEVMRWYRDSIAPTHKGGHEEARILSKWEREHPLRDLALASIKPPMVATWRDESLKRVSGSTVRVWMGLLHRVIERARNELGADLTENPVARVRKPKENRARDRRLRDDEEARLLRAMERGEQPGRHGGRGGAIHRPRNYWLKPAFIMALETGMRQGELLKLLRKDVDRERRIAVLRDTKNGSDRTIPLSNRAMAALREMPASMDDRVFPVTAEALKQSWARALQRARKSYEQECREAGLEPDPAMLTDLRWHDLRHEATSRFFEAGLNVMEVASITGHQDVRMLHRYTHVESMKLLDRIDAMQASDNVASLPHAAPGGDRSATGNMVDPHRSTG